MIPASRLRRRLAARLRPTPPAPEPSYRYKLEELKRRRRLALDLGAVEPVMLLNDKLDGYEFAASHGVEHPRVFGRYDSMATVEWDELPDDVVLKARTGSSGRGVWVLRRGAGGGFVDRMTSRSLSIEDLVRLHADGRAERRVSTAVFAEEPIERPDGRALADDWKFYCFGGRAEISMQRRVGGHLDQREWRFRFRDRSGVDLGPIKFADRHDPELDDAVDHDALVEAAETIAGAIDRVFVRVDLLESGAGPIFGEITPEPGPPELFAAEIDRRLGARWERVEAERFAASISST